MYERQLPLPVSPDRLWEALTDPDAIAGWFGAEVEWDLTPGAPARFTEDDGTIRHGVVEDVEPGRRLQFRWWPEDDGPDSASVVTWALDPDGDDTILSVTEAPVPAGGPAAITASAGVATAGAGLPADRWTAWDDRFVRIWAGVTSPHFVATRVVATR